MHSCRHQLILVCREIFRSIYKVPTCNVILLHHKVQNDLGLLTPAVSTTWVVTPAIYDISPPVMQNTGEQFFPVISSFFTINPIWSVCSICSACICNGWKCSCSSAGKLRVLCVRVELKLHTLFLHKVVENHA